MKLQGLSWEEKLENLLPKLPVWPLTTFGTMLFIALMLGMALGVYAWLDALAVRGLL